MLPDVDQGEFRARMELPRGTPLEQTAERVAQLHANLHHAVDHAAAHLGCEDLEGGGLEQDVLAAIGARFPTSPWELTAHAEAIGVGRGRVWNRIGD